MQWLDAVPTILVVLIILIAPGLVLAWSMAARGYALLALSPLFTVSLVAVAAIVCPVVGVAWSILPVMLLGLIASAVAFAIARVKLKRSQQWPQHRRTDSRFSFALVGTLLGTACLGARLTYVFIKPDSISQTYDNIFHLNAIQYILQTQQASSFTVGGMTGLPFYPSAWHALVSLTVQLARVDIPVAVNVTNLLLGAVVWPISCIFLCQQLLGQSKLASLLAGLISAAFASFPLLMVDFGVLYPNLLSIGVLPVLIALGLQLLRGSVVPDFPPAVGIFALVLATPGVALAHPSTLMAFFAFMAPATIIQFFASWRSWRLDWRASRARGVFWTVVFMIGAVTVVALWQAVRPAPEAAFWPPIQSPLGGLAELALNAQMNQPPAYILSGLVAVGAVVMIRRRSTWWALGMLAMAFMLFLVVSSFTPGRIRDFITGIWYNDSYRLAALVPVAAVLVASYGATWLVRRIEVAGRNVMSRRSGAFEETGQPGHRTGEPYWPGVAAVTVFAVLLQVGNVQYATEKARKSYELRPDSPLITADEMAVLSEMDKLVPRDAVIAVNPWNGSALAYALANRTPIQFHVLSESVSPSERILWSSLREAVGNPAVCSAVQTLGVTHVLDFGAQEINDGSHPIPGFENLEESGAVTKLSQHGSAKLFQLDACR